MSFTAIIIARFQHATQGPRIFIDHGRFPEIENATHDIIKQKMADSSALMDFAIDGARVYVVNAMVPPFFLTGNYNHVSMESFERMLFTRGELADTCNHAFVQAALRYGVDYFKYPTSILSAPKVDRLDVRPFLNWCRDGKIPEWVMPLPALPNKPVSKCPIYLGKRTSHRDFLCAMKRVRID